MTSPAHSDTASVPTLTPDQRISDVPERLAVALDARALEHTLQQQLVEQSLEALRPELERLARDTLARQAQLRWQDQSTRFDPDAGD